MNILFAHNNFPGQFHRLAVELAADPSNRVVFLSHYSRRGVAVPGVEHRLVPLPADAHLPEEAGIHGLPRSKCLSLLGTGERFADAMAELAKEGFRPDVVYGHVGFGCCIYAPDIFPRAAHMGYFEWFYTGGADAAFFAGSGPVPLTTRATRRQSNIGTLMALNDCLLGVCPTHWQLAQHPPEFAHKLHVLHDGVDTRFFTPSRSPGLRIGGVDLSGADELVTYATRGLEPYRGFPAFYRSLPAILEARPRAHAVIMADDRVIYGAARKDGRTWKEVLHEEVSLDESRVHFIPFQPYNQYRELLRASSVHVYLTVPFVLSWSMLEAMSCGCLLVASDTEPVREVVRDGVNGFLTDLRDAGALARRVTYCLENRKKLEAVRANARRTILDRYALASLLPRQVALVRAAMEMGRGLL